MPTTKPDHAIGRHFRALAICPHDAPQAGAANDLLYSTDGKLFTDAGAAFPPLRFNQWKVARLAIYCYGDAGIADFDFLHYAYGAAEKP